MWWFQRRQMERDAMLLALQKLATRLDEIEKKPDENNIGNIGVIVGKMTESIGRQLMSMSQFVEQAVQSQAATFQRQVDLLGALDERDSARERREAERKEQQRAERAKRALERQAQGRGPDGRILPKNPAARVELAAGDCPACAHGENASMTREQTIAHMQHRAVRNAQRVANGSAAGH